MKYTNCCTTSVRLHLHDSDYIESLALHMASKAKNCGEKNGLLRWSGKTLDLSKADKQLPSHPDDRDLLLGIFLDEHGSPTYFIPNSMMFGSVAAVYACNRVSRASWFLLTRLLVLPAALFYDDFPLFRQQGSGGRLAHPPNRKRQNTHTHTQKKNTRTRYIGRWSFYLGFLFQGAVYRDPDSGYIGQY